MVSAVNNSQSSQSAFAPPAAKAPSSSSSQNVSFQDAVAQYTQDTTAGAGGQIGSSAAGSSQALSSDLMSSLLAMQS